MTETQTLYLWFVGALHKQCQNIKFVSNYDLKDYSFRVQLFSETILSLKLFVKLFTKSSNDIRERSRDLYKSVKEGARPNGACLKNRSLWRFFWKFLDKYVKWGALTRSSAHPPPPLPSPMYASGIFSWNYKQGKWYLTFME